MGYAAHSYFGPKVVQYREMADLKILVEKPSAEKLKSLNVDSWPTWTKEPSKFDWHYDEKEICYILEGEVTVQTPDGAVSFGKNDLVVFPKGLSCAWDIKKAVRKYYRFG